MAAKVFFSAELAAAALLATEKQNNRMDSVASRFANQTWKMNIAGTPG